MSTATGTTVAAARSALADAQRRLDAATDEVVDAQEELSRARDELARAVGDLDVSASNVRTSACAPRAWDVDVTVTDTDGSAVASDEVTLVVGEYDGRPVSWGSLYHWVSDGPVLALLREHPGLCARVERVARHSIESSGVAHSPRVRGLARGAAPCAPLAEGPARDRTTTAALAAAEKKESQP